MRIASVFTAAALVIASCTSGPPPATATPEASAGLGQPAGSAPAQPRGPSLLSTIQDLSQRLIVPQQPTSFSYLQREQAVVASRIAVSPLSPQGTITVTGQPGAVPQTDLQHNMRIVEIDSIDTGTGACAQTNPDGSFSVTLPSGPGASLLVTARFPDTCVSQGPLTSAGAILRVPDGTQPGPTLPFRQSATNGEFKWTASGELLGAGASLQLDSPNMPAGHCLVPRLAIYRLFDGKGLYVSQQNVNVHGPVLTPTGLPLETEEGLEHWWALATPRPATACMRGSARYDISRWTEGLEPGWYRMRVVWYYLLGDGSTQEFRAPEGSFWNGIGLESNAGVGYLPLAPVGSPEAPIVPATLFNDAVSWASGGVRGAVAKEDEGRFGLSSRVVFPGPFIASPHDPLSGRKVKYLLEPFLPSFAYSAFDFVSPQPGMMLDDRQPGRLSVSWTKPDGKTTDLAKDAAISQAFISGTTGTYYQAEASFSGPGRTYGITTGQPGLVVEFDQYGKNTITLSGTLRSAWGQDLRIRGTYEITVAEPLDLSLGAFIGTPLEVGEELSPLVIVHPGVPADVEMSVDFYPDGDASKKQTFRTSGKANRSGYFVGKEAFKASAPGEYLARWTARWTDPADNVPWTATRTAASIVATPKTPLIAHGERNSMISNEITNDGQLRTWLFTRAFDPACGEAACDPIGKHGARTVGQYPFFRGDVAWQNDYSPITPSITLEDPTGILRRLAPQVADSDTDRCNPPAPACPAPDSMYVRTHTTAGVGASGRPGAVDSWAYWYTTTQHADGVNIREIASEWHATHDHWYGHEAYSCQIGLACYRAWNDGPSGEDRQGDEEGDPKIFLGGVVIRSAAGAQFVPYASMSIIVPEAFVTSPQGQNPPTYRHRDAKGNRICPPYQGAAGGVGTCGPLLTVQGLDYDLFITPLGTRSGDVLEPGDTFTFSGEAWPTLDVAYVVTVTSPSGKEQKFTGRASQVGYIDSAGKSFQVSEPGVWTVHVSATQDRPVPSTGSVPDPIIVADGRTKVKGYSAPLSAVLGSKDSTYRFVVAAPKPDLAVTTEVAFGQQRQGGPRGPNAITMTVALPNGATNVRAFVGKQGLVVSDVQVSGGQARIELNAQKLYADGFTNVVVGASSLDITVAGQAGSEWFARTVNLRGMTPLGGARATIR